MDNFDYTNFEKLWDKHELHAELSAFLGGDDKVEEARWSLDAGMDQRFNEHMEAGKPVEEFYEQEDGFIYQSLWNAATNDERAKYIAHRNYALEHGYTTMLDYGAGTGSGLVTMAMSGIKATGVDLSKPNLEFMKARRERFFMTDMITVIHANAKGKWNWRRFKYDLVVCTEVFEHVADPIGLAKELYEVINPGGAMIASWSFVQMTTHLPEHFHLQNTHPDTVVTEGFGKILIEEIGFEFDRLLWFNNYAFRKPA